MTVTFEMNWRSAFLSDTGPVRKVNEDSFFEAPDLGLWAVADGMGGHEAGQLASRLIVESLDAIPPASSPESFVRSVRDQLAQVNRRLRQISLDQYGGRVIGSTVAILLRFDRASMCLWAGDSRIYRRRNGLLEQLTRDHSRVEEMIDQGLLERSEAEGHRLANVITRAVGAQDTLVLDLREDEALEGDVYMLCSDGLTKVIGEPEIGRILAGDDCERMAEQLLALALERGTNDNVTVGIVQISETDAMPTLVPGTKF
jgi:serine/threonine protein phosphatase PrpC